MAVIVRPLSTARSRLLAVCSPTDLVGDLVRVVTYGPTLVVERVDPTDRTKIPGVAIVVSKSTATECVLQFEGEVSVYSGLVPGREYWADSAGRPSLTPVPLTLTPGALFFLQALGVALTPTTINFDPSESIKAIRG